VAGLFAGITYEYIGSIKPNIDPHSSNSSTAELKHQFTSKPRQQQPPVRPSSSMCPSPQSVITSPTSSYSINTLVHNCAQTNPSRSHSQHTLHLPSPNGSTQIGCNSSAALLSALASPEAPFSVINETEFGCAIIGCNGSSLTGTDPSQLHPRPEPERQPLQNRF